MCLEILECESTPCLNDGKCIEGSFGSGVGSGLDTSESAYTCECKPGFTGKNCETSKFLRSFEALLILTTCKLHLLNIVHDPSLKSLHFLPYF